MMRDIFLLPTSITAEYGLYAIVGLLLLLLSLIGLFVAIITKRKQVLSWLYISSAGIILILPWILILVVGDNLELFYFFSPLSFLIAIILLIIGLLKKIDKLLLSLPASSSIGYWAIAIFGEITAQI